MTSITTREGILHPKKVWNPLSNLWENFRKPFNKAETMSAVIPKPNLRGFLRRDTYRSMAIATAISTAFCVAWQVWFVNPRQNAEKEFFKNYEPFWWLTPEERKALKQRQERIKKLYEKLDKQNRS